MRCVCVLFAVSTWLVPTPIVRLTTAALRITTRTATDGTTGAIGTIAGTTITRTTITRGTDTGDIGQLATEECKSLYSLSIYNVN